MTMYTDQIDKIAAETAQKICVDPDNLSQFKAEIAGAIITHRDAEIERLRERNTEHEARYDALEAKEQYHKRDAERLRTFVDFVNLWCHRESAVTAPERISIIMHHPVAKARLNEQAAPAKDRG